MYRKTKLSDIKSRCRKIIEQLTKKKQKAIKDWKESNAKKISDKEKVSYLAFYLGQTMGFISNNNLFDKFKEEHKNVLEGIDEIIYNKPKPCKPLDTKPTEKK